MAKCSLLSWVWNNVIPRYNSKIIHPMDQTSHGCDHPSSVIQTDHYYRYTVAQHMYTDIWQVYYLCTVMKCKWTNYVQLFFTKNKNITSPPYYFSAKWHALVTVINVRALNIVKKGIFNAQLLNWSSWYILPLGATKAIIQWKNCRGYQTLEKLQCLACHYIQQVSHISGMLRNNNMYELGSSSNFNRSTHSFVRYPISIILAYQEWLQVLCNALWTQWCYGVHGQKLHCQNQSILHPSFSHAWYLASAER